MRTRRSREPFNALVLAALAVVVTAVLIAAGGGNDRHPAPVGEPSWQGLAGAQRPRVAVGQRVIVVLKAPALAERVGNAGGLATSEDEQRWTETAVAAQKLLVARLRVEGVVAQPEFSYTHTINGFSAAFDARGIALLERAPEVAGVYPVRAAYPATIDLGAQSAQRPGIALSDRDGRGVSIALLDTGVDRAHPFLRGRVTAGVDGVGGGPHASAAPQPDAAAAIPTHPLLPSRTRRRSSRRTAPRWPACSSVPAGRARLPASRRERHCCRFASQGGSGTRRRVGPSTRVATSCWPVSSARSTPMTTATPTMLRASRSSASRSLSRALPTRRSRWR